ncbi:unnamed protein product [Orchesella dallaii]|uniref:Retrotransposon gag domain-containing protein n=1 Tax=Orchesella dallaii TaxID=48710 RepID=A0ABP1QD56_9HEXA
MSDKSKKDFMSSINRTTRSRAKRSVNFQHFQLPMRGREVAEAVVTRTTRIASTLDMDSANRNPGGLLSSALMSDAELATQYPGLFIRRPVPPSTPPGPSANRNRDGTGDEFNIHNVSQNLNATKEIGDEEGIEIDDGLSSEDAGDVERNNGETVDNRHQDNEERASNQGDSEAPAVPTARTVEEINEEMKNMRIAMLALSRENEVFSRANRILIGQNKDLESMVDNRDMHTQRRQSAQRTDPDDINPSIDARHFTNRFLVDRHAQVDGVRNALAQATGQHAPALDNAFSENRRHTQNRTNALYTSFAPRVNSRPNTPITTNAGNPLSSNEGYSHLQSHDRAGWETAYQPHGRRPMAYGGYRANPNKEIRSLIKNIEPPSFTGKADSKSAYDFLLELEKYQSITGCSNNLLLRGIIPYALKDRAYAWYETEDLIEKFKGWSDFVLRFRRKFQSYDYYEALKREIDQRSQGKNEPLTDYISIIISFYRRLDRVVQSEEIIRKVAWGLHPSYMTFYRDIATSDDLRSLIQNAQIVDDIIERRKNYKPPPTENLIEPGLGYMQDLHPESQFDNRSRRDTYLNRREQSGFRRERSDSRDSISNQPTGSKVSFALPPKGTSDSHPYDKDKRIFDSGRIRSDSKDRVFDRDFKPIFKRNSSEERSSRGDRSRSQSPSNDRATSQFPQGCFECGGDHMIRNCPRKNQNQGNGRNPSQARQ